MNVETNYYINYENITFISDFSEIKNNYLKISDISVSNKKLLEKKKVIQKFDNEMDLIFFESIRYYFNLSCILFISLDIESVFLKYKNNFKNEFDLYGIKELFVSKKVLINIIYQMKNNEFDSLYDIENFIDKNYVIKDNKYKLIVLILKENENVISYFNKFNKNKKLNNYIIPFNMCQKITLIGILFNKTSLDFYEIQRIEFFVHNNKNKGFEYFNLYRDWFYNNIDPRDIHKFMLFSSIVLCLLGLRDSNDLDLYISNLNYSYSNNIEHKVNSTYILKNDKYSFIDASIEGTNKWKHYWKKWLNEWAQKCGADNFEKILNNPKYHFYFLGIKIIDLNCDLVRRIIRNRPRSSADLIMINKNFNFNIKIPYIPDTIIEYTQMKNITNNEMNKMLRTGSTIDLELNELKTSIKNDKDKFLKTISWIIKLRYNEILNSNEILKLIDNSNKKKIKLKIKK